MLDRTNKNLQLVTVPAALGGWNTKDSFSSMPPIDAIVIDNWIPRPDCLEIRKGYQIITGQLISNKHKRLHDNKQDKVKELRNDISSGMRKILDFQQRIKTYVLPPNEITEIAVTLQTTWITVKSKIIALTTLLEEILELNSDIDENYNTMSLISKLGWAKKQLKTVVHEIEAETRFLENINIEKQKLDATYDSDADKMAKAKTMNATAKYLEMQAQAKNLLIQAKNNKIAKQKLYVRDLEEALVQAISTSSLDAAKSVAVSQVPQQAQPSNIENERNMEKILRKLLAESNSSKFVEENNLSNILANLEKDERFNITNYSILKGYEIIKKPSLQPSSWPSPSPSSFQPSPSPSSAALINKTPDEINRMLTAAKEKLASYEAEKCEKSINEKRASAAKYISEEIYLQLQLEQLNSQLRDERSFLTATLTLSIKLKEKLAKATKKHSTATSQLNGIIEKQDKLKKAQEIFKGWNTKITNLFWSDYDSLAKECFTVILNMLPLCVEEVRDELNNIFYEISETNRLLNDCNKSQLAKQTEISKLEQEIQRLKKTLKDLEITKREEAASKTANLDIIFKSVKTVLNELEKIELSPILFVKGLDFPLKKSSKKIKQQKYDMLIPYNVSGVERLLTCYSAGNDKRRIGWVSMPPNDVVTVERFNVVRRAKLIAEDNDDITLEYYFSADGTRRVVTPAASTYTGLVTVGKFWNYALFSECLYLVNGVDKPLKYYVNKDTMTHGLSLMSIAFSPEYDFIPEPTEINNIVVFNQRVFLSCNNSLDLWFSAMGMAESYRLPRETVDDKEKSLRFALKKFNLAFYAKLGGRIVVLTTWSRIGSDTLNDKLIVITDCGELLVCSGTNPGDQSNFNVEAVYRIPPPINSRSVSNLGGDVCILTKSGYISLLALFSNTLSSNVENVTLSSKIGTEVVSVLEEDNAAPKRFEYWQILFYNNDNLLLVNVPDRTEGRLRACQHVLNFATGAWTRFTDVDATCFAMFKGELYMSLASGGIAKMFQGHTDNNQAICATVQQAYNNFGSPALKIFKLIKLWGQTTNSSRLSFALTVDSDERSAMETETQLQANNRPVQTNIVTYTHTGCYGGIKIAIPESVGLTKWFSTTVSFTVCK